MRLTELILYICKSI